MRKKTFLVRVTVYTQRTLLPKTRKYKTSAPEPVVTKSNQPTKPAGVPRRGVSSLGRFKFLVGIKKYCRPVNHTGTVDVLATLFHPKSLVPVLMADPDEVAKVRPYTRIHCRRYRGGKSLSAWTRRQHPLPQPSIQSPITSVAVLKIRRYSIIFTVSVW